MPSKRKTYDTATHGASPADNIHAQCCLAESLGYEEVLKLTGPGSVNMLVLIACSLGLLAVGFQNGVTAYLLPIAKCDLNINARQMGFINVAFMIGGICSACLWGVLSDMMGSRQILMVTFFCDGIICATSSLVQSSMMLLLSRALNGFFIGGPGCLLFSYLADLTLPPLRTTYTCLVGFSFIMSWILLPGLALVILPMHYTYSIQHVNIFCSWRLYLLLISLPSLICVALFYKLPESPKLLLQNGYTRQAIIILRSMYTLNTGKAEKYYMMEKMREVNTPAIAENSRVREYRSHNHKLRWLGTQTLLVTGELFSKNYAVTTIILSIVFFINMFGCYGFGLWIPELFIQLNEADRDLGVVVNSTNTDSVLCNNSIQHKSIHGTIWVGVVCLGYNMCSVIMSRMLDGGGVRVLGALSLGLAGVSCLGLLLPIHLLHVPAASLFQAAMTTGNILIVGLATEAYPPPLRSMALCVATMSGRLGSICSNLLFASQLNTRVFTIILLSLLSVGGGLLVLLVPPSRPSPPPAVHYRDKEVDFQ